MHKKIAVLAVVILFSQLAAIEIASSASSSTPPALSNMVQLQQKVTNISQDLDDAILINQQSMLAISVLQNNVVTLQSEKVNYSDLQLLQSTFEGDLSTVNSSVTSLTENYSNLRTDLNNVRLAVLPQIQDDIVSLELSVANLREDTVELANAVNENNTALTSELNSLASKIPRQPIVEDAQGRTIGLLMGPGYRGVYDIYSSDLNLVFSVQRGSGKLVHYAAGLNNTDTIYFPQAGCTGQAYGNPSEFAGIASGGSSDRFFKVENYATSTGNATVKSIINRGSCQSASSTIGSINGRTPLKEITLPFSVPLEAPLVIMPSY